ncbi:MAG TPA: inorganic phosphate transporter [Chthoniobacterales bacterium]|nr:inorganic phosphate transporter [Chthoniobacterales bacterium]
MSVSPIVGFGVAALIFFLLRVFIKDERIFKPADQQSPPWWVRGVLVLTCTGLSFAHGTNDGQKGMGLLMLVLIVVLPSALALNPNLTQQDVHQLVEQLNQGIKYVQTKSQNRQPPAAADATKVLTSYDSASGKINNDVFPALSVKMTELRSALAEKNSIQDLPFPERQQQRQNGYLISEAIQKLRKEQAIGKADLQELGIH